MKKNIAALSLLLVFTTITHKASADQGWGRFILSLFYSSDKKQTQPQSTKHQSDSHYTISDKDWHSIKLDLCARMDRLFATNQQPEDIKPEIETIKKRAVQHTIDAVKHRPYSNIKALREAVGIQFDDQLANAIGKNARKVYEYKAAHASGRPAYNPAYLVNQAEQEIREHALKAIRFNEHGALVYFVGHELNKQMCKKISYDYPQPYTSPVSQDDHIFEVYPNANSQRYEATVQKISQGSVHRESDCCVCMEDFGPNRKRVTLACGHSICLACLYNWLHVQHKNSCPLCRDTIRSDEFTASYLQQYI